MVAVNEVGTGCCCVCKASDAPLHGSSWCSICFCEVQTNNPRKLQVLSALGVDVTGRVPCIVKAQEFNEDYMATKAARMSHELNGEYCIWDHRGEPMPPYNGSLVNGNGNGSTASPAQQMPEADSSELDSSDTDVLLLP